MPAVPEQSIWTETYLPLRFQFYDSISEMIIHDVIQGAPEWAAKRAGIPTASEFHRLLTPAFKLRTGEMVETYLAQKVVEWWLGGPMMSACVWDMEMGRILEEEARPWLACELGQEIQTVGFITSDDGRYGCSPDGLLVDRGVEIKCPQPVNHVKCLMTGEVPDEYLPQVHGGMFVTGFDSWMFMSYRRGFPKFVTTVRRDETIQAAIKLAIDGFCIKLDAAKEHMIDLNGGPPPRSRFNAPVPDFVSEMPS